MSATIEEIKLFVKNKTLLVTDKWSDKRSFLFISNDPNDKGIPIRLGMKGMEPTTDQKDPIVICIMELENDDPHIETLNKFIKVGSIMNIDYGRYVYKGISTDPSHNGSMLFEPLNL